MKTIKTSESTPIVADILTSELLHQPGQICLTMAPGKKDKEAEFLWNRNLQTDLKRLRNHYGVERLTCLLEDEELCELGILSLLTAVEAFGMTTEHLPIPDDGLPDSIAEFADLVKRLVNAVSAGETILIHCKGGRGRTGMLAAACLVQLNYSPEDAIATVQRVRSGALSTARQQDFVYQFKDFLSSQS